MSRKSDIRHIIDYFKGRDEVSALYIFGSAANNKEKDESDIDIAVLINDIRKGRRTYDSLRKVYFAASPKLSIRPLDIVMLNTASLFLKHRIIKTGKVLFDRNRKLRVKFTANTIIEYLDYKPIEDICLKAVTNRFRRLTVGR